MHLSRTFPGLAFGPGWRQALVCIAAALSLATGISAAGQFPILGTYPTEPQPNDDESPTNGLGSWIWAAHTSDRQTVQFWRDFDIPHGKQVTRAKLQMTVDNEYTLYLDGREIGRGAEWRELFSYDVSKLMTPGKHILAVKAYNSFTFAGMIFGFRVDLADGSFVEVQSDETWRVVPENARHWERAPKAVESWPAATVIAPLGGKPWWTAPTSINLMPALMPIKLHFWERGWVQVAFVVLSALVTIISLRLVAQVAWHRKEQWLLQQERLRIARDIHDDLGSRMTRLVLHGEVAQSELPADSATRVEIEQICEQARGILSTMDEILWAVNPKRDSFGDFMSYVCGYAQEYLAPSGIHCLFDLAPAVSDVVLNLPLKRALLMGLKEALNNAVKHSGATELTITIKTHGQKLSMAIVDNGKGFDPAAPKPGRNGLPNMTQRMTELDGTCVLTSRPGEGCRAEFIVPLKRARRAAQLLPVAWEPFRPPSDQVDHNQPNEAAEIQHVAER